MTEAEERLRHIWTDQGVPQEDQDRLIADISAKAQPGANVGPFKVPHATELTPEGEQYVLPGCGRNRDPKQKQLNLF